MDQYNMIASHTNLLVKCGTKLSCCKYNKYRTLQCCLSSPSIALHLLMSMDAIVEIVYYEFFLIVSLIGKIAGYDVRLGVSFDIQFFYGTWRVKYPVVLINIIVGLFDLSKKKKKKKSVMVIHFLEISRTRHLKKI